MKCNICGREVVLRPSASERARRYGGTPADYTALFPAHAECVVGKRRAEARQTMALHRANPGAFACL